MTVGHVFGLTPDMLFSEAMERHVVVLVVLLCPHGRPGPRIPAVLIQVV